MEPESFSKLPPDWWRCGGVSVFEQDGHLVVGTVRTDTGDIMDWTSIASLFCNFKCVTTINVFRCYKLVTKKKRLHTLNLLHALL